MEHYEQLGTFYLGKEYDLAKQNTTNSLVLYDSKDLVTHGVCLGMTGSGKTGLCLVLLEEAILDNIPIMVIDPKGDISNLLLTFPKLSTEDFLPWINEDDAVKKGLNVNSFAKQQSELWKKGLEDWGQGPDRILKLRNSADFIIYTPGSKTGIPISILNSFSTPPQEILDDNELLIERITNTVTGLLVLVGIDANPIESREHILLSKILETNWKNGKSLTLEEIIQNVQIPNIHKIGILDLESFFPSKDRFNLVMTLNNLLASTNFSSWMDGIPLDIQNILYDKNGKARVSIFSISHLNENERMFFVTLLLNQIVSWMRTQSGTSSLRSILYMDEIMGFLPPVANPPSKAPFLTLLKQARAFGLGILLATQNPVDLDYKALSNIGTWFLGRLQTERDKLRVIDGLEGALQGRNHQFDREMMNKLISGLENRVFLMNNIHEDSPILFHTRWAMSYLRGPLTRNQIKLLMDPIRSSIEATFYKINPSNKKEFSVRKEIPNDSNTTKSNTENEQRVPVQYTKQLSSKLDTKILNEKYNNIPPTLPPEIPQYYFPLSFITSSYSSIDDLIYHPMVFAFVSINIKDSRFGLDFFKEYSYIVPIRDTPIPVNWDDASEVTISVNQLEKKHSLQNFSEIPTVATKKEQYGIWKKDLVNWLANTKRLVIYKHSLVNLFSKLDESETDFKIRSQILVREYRDELVEKLRSKYSSKFNTLKDKIENAEKTIEIQRQQAEQQKMNTVISVGATLLGAFMGRKLSRSKNNTSTIIRDVGRTMKEQKDISRAKETLESLYNNYSELENEFKKQINEIESSVKNNDKNLLTIDIVPTRKDISVKLLSLVWIPSSKDKISTHENK